MATTAATPAPGAAPAAGAPGTRPAREHRHDVDLLRLVASCTVILSHVAAAFLKAVDGDAANGSAAYWVGMTGDSAGSFAVPVFFAIAGWAVLVGAPPRDSRRLWQRVVRNTTPLFLWTAAYLGWAWLRGRNDEPVTDLAVRGLFGSIQPAYHLWFMYVYIPIVALLAFAALVKAGARPWGTGAALLGIACLPSALTTLGEITGHDAPSTGWGFTTYSVVYAVGGALVLSMPRRLPARHRRWLLLVAPAAVLGIIRYNTRIHYVIPNAHLFVAALTLAVMLLLCRVRVPERWRPRISRVAGAALGAYMVHVFFVEELVRPLIPTDAGLVATTGVFLGLLPVTIVLSYAVSMLWGRLGLRRILG
ncbi:acyltransferase [Streptomyces sp. RFCAC02]|uniref:acyltransferase n=1 Tax=Streptomyces sp. RFCAC02 TaxID=2499143 RepID=UPI001021D739|nr:acyltransferase [Streptomyces sp. RFCAC02]